MCNNGKDFSNANNDETNNEKILESSNLQHAPTTQDSTTIHQTTTSDNHQSSPVEHVSSNSSTSITHGVSATIPSEKTDDSITKSSTQKKTFWKNGENLNSGELVYSLDKHGCENIMKDVHKKCRGFCKCTSERRRKIPKRHNKWWHD